MPVRENTVVGEEQLGTLADQIKSLSAQRVTSPLRATIAETTQRVFTQDILPATKSRARPHVGGYSDEIDEESYGWNGVQYQHGIVSESVVVRSHEHGTGLYNDQGHGTINAVDDTPDGHGRRQGYKIPGPVSIGSDGSPVVVDYVIHPGVKPKHFISRTMDDMEDHLANEVADAMESAVEDVLDG